MYPSEYIEITRPKNETKTVNKTLSGSMKTPAVMDEEIHGTDEVRRPWELEAMSETREKAKIVVTKFMMTA